MSEPSMRSVAVLGAGIVGVSCALHLRRRGWQVTMIDRGEPGGETSYGNAGVISGGGFVPTNMPQIRRQLPVLARNKGTGLRYTPAYLAKNLRWLLGFLASANEESVRRRAAAMSGLTALSIEAHRALMQEAGIEDRLRDTGWLKLYRSKEGFHAGRLGRELLDQYGVETDFLSPGDIHDLEPHLKRIFTHGYLIKSAASVDSPGKVTVAYADLFAKDGGAIVPSAARAIEPRDDGYDVVTETERYRVAHVVVALGPWSTDLLKPLGVHIPLAVERGYHCHYTVENGAELQRPCHDVQGGYVVTPMEQGYRLTTGIELADREAPPTPVQLDRVLPVVRQAFPLAGPLDNAPWLGRRPSLPDCLPVIGEAPGKKNLWLAFGHGHVGFATGPSTGQVLTEMMSGDPLSADVSGLSPARFGP